MEIENRTYEYTVEGEEALSLSFKPPPLVLKLEQCDATLQDPIMMWRLYQFSWILSPWSIAVNILTLILSLEHLAANVEEVKAVEMEAIPKAMDTTSDRPRSVVGVIEYIKKEGVEVTTGLVIFGSSAQSTSA